MSQLETRAADANPSSPDGAMVAVLTGGAKGKSARIPGEMGGVLKIGKAPDNELVLPDEIWTPWQNPRLRLEVSFPVRLGDLIDYPYREIWPTLEQMAERVGTDRLMWGTDMPFQNRFCTYRQSRAWIERYCTFLGSGGLADVMGGTAARLFGLADGPSSGAAAAARSAPRT